MNPVIGITCTFNYRLQQNALAASYVRAVEAAGGLPLLLPLMGAENRERLWEIIDGLLLSGGGDIGSFCFEEEPHPGQGEVYPPLDEQEIHLASRALVLKVPLLGICRGMQVLNVAAGGTLYQDIRRQKPGALQHVQKMPRQYPVHSILISEASFLASLTGELFLRVNSFHHQAVSRTAPGFRVSAAACDGVVEAVEARAHPFALGVQWHPEAMSDVASRRLFRGFLKACK